MGDLPSRKAGPFVAYVLVALVSGASSVALAVVVSTIMSRFNTMSSDAIAFLSAMPAGPAVMGIAISFFVYRTSALPRPGDLD